MMFIILNTNIALFEWCYEELNLWCFIFIFIFSKKVTFWIQKNI